MLVKVILIVWFGMRKPPGTCKVAQSLSPDIGFSHSPELVSLVYMVVFREMNRHCEWKLHNVQLFISVIF